MGAKPNKYGHPSWVSTAHIFCTLRLIVQKPHMHTCPVFAQHPDCSVFEQVPLMPLTIVTGIMYVCELYCELFTCIVEYTQGPLYQIHLSRTHKGVDMVSNNTQVHHNIQMMLSWYQCQATFFLSSFPSQVLVNSCPLVDLTQLRKMQPILIFCCCNPSFSKFYLL